MAEKKKNDAPEVEPEEKKLDPKYLKGLRFRGSKSKIVEDKDTGTRKREYIPYEREMSPEDVLSWKEHGNTVVIVTADGQKITVDR